MSARTTAAPATLLQAAAEVAELAAGVAMRWYRQTFDVDIKGDGSPVTIADRTAEQEARAWIAQRFPHDGIMGEEFGLERGDAPRRWILDPIDGTKAFVRGVPLWGTLIACCEGETVLAGAACYPAVGELVAAAPGEGCWWNGSRAQVSRASSLAHATVLITDERFPDRPARRARWQALAADANVARTWGDCYGYLLVATGRAEVMVDDIVNPWDAAAIQPLITEAGGVFTDWRGRATAFGGDLIATNAGVARATRAHLVEPESHT
ncbi:MAG: histidinol-phosphatase [Gemmatimonadetes bacterium]|nr:histidinol-phosphatase [Gemmatimonadota bacterium]